MKNVLPNLATGVLTLCAITVTALVVRRELFAPAPVAAAAPAERKVADGARLASEGRVLGPADAKVRIVEFADFQCPFCAQVSARLDSIRALDPERVAIVYRHLPLSNIHPHAFTAALAAECAGEQGRFEEYHDALYAAQDSIGTRPWDAFAARAGVKDAERFRACVKEERFRARVEADVRAATAAGIDGTPTFVFGDRLVGGAGAPDLLREWVREALD